MIQNGKCAFSAQFESSEIVALKRISILFRNCLQPFLPRRHVHSEDYALARCPSTFQLQQFPEYQGVPHLHQGPCAATRHLSEIFFYTQSEYFTISNGIFNFNFLALVVFEILEVSQIYIRRPLYPRTKFYTPVEHFTISNVVFNFNFLTLVVSEMFGPKFT